MAIETDELAAEQTVTETAPPIEEELREAEHDADAADEFDLERTPIRLAIAVAMPTLACAIMVGGIYEGISPRIYAAVAGLFGIGLALVAARLQRRPWLSYAVIVVGLFAIGLLMLFPALGDMLKVTSLVSEANSQSSVLRPPVPFDPGWHAVVGWLMALVAFTAAWMATVVGARALGLLLPLPVAAIAGISVPDGQQVASGAVVLVLFAVGLGLLSSENAVGEGDERPGTAYEIRKALKALPLIALLVVALIFGQKYVGFLFPDPLIDPAQEPQRPKAQPLSDVEDRVLFEIDSELTGPWRTGVLDVYGSDGWWRLPPFAASEVEEVPTSGIVDDRPPANRATITVRGLSGAVLPDLPNTVGIIAEGPTLGFDDRAGTIRLVNGQVEAGLQYTVAAAGLPKVDELRASDSEPLPEGVQQFIEMPGDPPPAVQSLIDRAAAEAEGQSKWDRFDFLRTWILDNVVATGTGTPKEVPAARVDDMIAGSQRGTPFEIVAAQTMLARWLDIPARIGYGFDGGKKAGDLLAVHPAHGAAWVEVYFPGYQWLPVIGTPKKAEPTVGSDPSQQRIDNTILPSDDVGAQIYIPLVDPPGSVLAKQIAVTTLTLVPIILFLLALYFAYPAVRKAILRNRRRQEALRHGVRARVGLAYAELRDYATDLGYAYPTDTPLMFLERCMDDEEHTELAWLTTRAMWGDLRESDDLQLATTAEELSRSLRRRLGLTQPVSVRSLAVISRLALRDPYMPEPPKQGRASRRRKERAREAVPA
jgi:transglutaminase-like putative cysteine protease